MSLRQFPVHEQQDRGMQHPKNTHSVPIGRRSGETLVQKHFNTKWREWTVQAQRFTTCELNKSQLRQQTLHKQQQLNLHLKHTLPVFVFASRWLFLSTCWLSMPRSPASDTNTCRPGKWLRGLFDLPQPTHRANKAMFALSAPTSRFLFFSSLFEVAGDKRRCVQGGSSSERAAMIEAEQRRRWKGKRWCRSRL